MDLQEFKKQYIQQELGIKEEFGRLMTFIDFVNVNHWFEEDRQTYDYVALKDDEKLVIDFKKLKEFADLFSLDIRFYYGHDQRNFGSVGFIQKAEEVFGKRRVFTKQIQKVKHHLQSQLEIDQNTRKLFHDQEGDYIFIPKCNFDVEISVDAIKTLEHYDTICLFSGDADFVHLLRFLKQKGKKVIVVKGGHVVHQLKDIADLVINAQDIKKHITDIKQKPGVKPGLADRNPESTGRTT